MDGNDWEWLRGEVTRSAKAFADQLRLVDDSSIRVPNLEWSVAGLAAHLISLPSLYLDQNQRTEPFERPTDFPAFSRSVRSHITETEPGRLAELLTGEVQGLLEDLGDDPEQPWVLYGQATTAANVAAGLLGELVLHGQDLAKLAGPSPELTPRHAQAIIGQSMALAPFFIDRDRARKCTGTYSIRIRGGEAYTYRVADGILTVEPGKPDRADARMVADPVAFVLVSLGRMSEVKAGLTGKIVAYGRKPWLLARLGKTKVDGI